jgi:DsbC/DsbD-like thiol-disulfide interchange protein
MTIRSIILALACSVLALPAVAAEKPYRVSLVGDSYDGKVWRTGVRIELEDGWKTYWRMPGDAGVPPDFTWTTSVPAEVDVQYPVPGRYLDASGETVGYGHEVVLPVTVDVGSASAVSLGLKLFFGVCKDICIPVQAEAAIELGTMAQDADGAARVEKAMASVPVPGDAVTAASLDDEGGKPVLVLTLDRAVDDIFVEAANAAYFGAPRFSADGRQAVLPIANVADGKVLSGTPLRLTLRTGNTGLEQTVTLP